MLSWRDVEDSDFELRQIFLRMCIALFNIMRISQAHR